MNDTNKPEVKASEIDIRGTFLKLDNTDIWRAGAGGRMRLNIPTADALAHAMNPASGFNEAAIICYLLEWRLATEAGEEADQREIFTAIQQIKGRLRSPAMSGAELALIGWAQKLRGAR